MPFSSSMMKRLEHKELNTSSQVIQILNDRTRFGMMICANTKSSLMSILPPRHSDMFACVCVQSLSHVWLLWPHGLQPARLLCPWAFPSTNTVVGYHLLLQRIFPTQGSNPHLLCLPHWHVGSVPPSPRGSHACAHVCTQKWSYFAWKIYGFNRHTHSESKPVTTTCIPSLIKFIWWIFTEHHHILGISQESAVNKAGRGKEQGSTNAFCGGPESKYFRLWGQQVCHNSSSALTEPKQPLEICKQMGMAAFQ